MACIHLLEKGDMRTLLQTVLSTMMSFGLLYNQSMIFQSKRETPLTKLKAYWALVVEAVKTQQVLEPAVYKRINRIIGYVVFELEWKMLW